MKAKIWYAGVLVLGCIGCSNIGNAPTPMNPDELNAAVNKLSPKDQIDYINRSSLPADMKAQRIKDIEDKTGYKPADPSGSPGSP